MKKILYAVAILVCVLCSCTSKTEVLSPDGRIKWSFQLEEKGKMVYQVSVNGQPFILPSELGFEEKSGLNLKDGFQVVNTAF